MSVGAKLQLKPGHKVAILGVPDGVEIDLPVGASRACGPETADAVVLFVTTKAELSERGGSVLDAARAERLAWVAYPKAGQLGTDLHRDSLAGYLSSQGVRPMRQIAIDERWSALRFRPATAR